MPRLTRKKLFFVNETTPSRPHTNDDSSHIAAVVFAVPLRDSGDARHRGRFLVVLGPKDLADRAHRRRRRRRSAAVRPRSAHVQEAPQDGAVGGGTADAATTIAVKTQSDNSIVTCPGGGKKCMGTRKEGVATIQPAKGTSKETKPSVPAKSVPPPPPASAVQSNNYPKPRRDSAPSKIGGNDRSDRKRAHKV